MTRRLSGRKYEIKKERKVVYIYSEGEVTEPQYFTSIKRELRLPEVHIELIGTGFNTISLVKHVLTERGVQNDESEWWVVFDKDDHVNFNQAIQNAEASGLKVAYSNECFELWFILHFEYLQTALGGARFKDKLTGLLSAKYKKNMDVYTLIKGRESEAIRNARNLEKMHDDNSATSKQDRVPSTTVYKLVERLRLLKQES